MAMKTSIELEKSAALQVATLMVAAARTAPKTRGIDNIKTAAVRGGLSSGRFGGKLKRVTTHAFLCRSNCSTLMGWPIICTSRLRTLSSG
jgi:hypothetical protein